MEHFKRRAKNPEVRDWICQDWVSAEERKRRMRSIFGLPLVPLKTHSPFHQPSRMNIPVLKTTRQLHYFFC
jgi:hypothetical protein